MTNAVALKSKHRAMWAMGDYPAVATDVIAELGPVLVAPPGIRAGDRVSTSPPVPATRAIPAALPGADVSPAT